MFVAATDDPLPASGALFRTWQYETSIIVRNSHFLGNHVGCLHCSGGGVSFGPNGNVSLSGVSVVGNTAGFFGGGVMAGDTSFGTSSLQFSMVDSVVMGNAAVRSGAQLYDAAGGNLTITASVVSLGPSVSAVRFAAAAAIVVDCCVCSSTCVAMTCRCWPRRRAVCPSTTFCFSARPDICFRTVLVACTALMAHTPRLLVHHGPPMFTASRTG